MTDQPALASSPAETFPAAQPYAAQPYAEQPYAEQPWAAQPAGPVPMTPADETTWSTVGHLSWIAGSFLGLPFLAPLVLFLVLRERGPFVRHHAAEALNFQLSLLLYGLGVAAVGGILTLVTFGLLAPVWALAGGALVVVGVVLTVLAAVAASRGQWYRYPLTVRFVH